MFSKMKRVLSLVFAVTMLVTLLPVIGAADTAVVVETTDGEAATVGNTLKAELPGATGSVSYQWYRGNEAVSGAINQEYILTFDDQLYGPVKCVITDANGEHESEEITVTSDFNPESGFVTATNCELVGADNAKWTFKMKDNADRSYTLLDTFNNSEGKYLILANQRHGAEKIEYTTPNGAKYDPSIEGSYPARVNAIAMGTSENALPTEMKEAINENQVWATEKPTGSTPVITDAYTVKVPVVVPAGWELEKYKSRINFNMTDSTEYFWLLRTAFDAYNVGTEENPQYSVYMYYARSKANSNWLNGGTSLYTAYRSTKAVSSLNWKATYSLYRPMFCLNDTFFKLGGIDLSSAGSEIINIISQYSYSELSKAGYTDDEISTYLPNVTIPVIDVEVETTDGKAATVGNTLKAELEDATGSVSYQWYRGNEAVSGAINQEYILTFDDQLYGPVKCVITDANGEHESEEITVTSDFNPESGFVTATNCELVGADNAKWTFKMKDNADRSYTLLDTFNNSEGKYLILANQRHGAEKIEYTTPNGAKYDPSIEGSYPARVNAIAMGTSENALPTEMKEAINENQVWATEKPTGSTPVITDAYTVKVPVVVPAGWELEKYKSRINFNMTDSTEYFWLLRTAFDAYNVGTEENPQYSVYMYYARSKANSNWLNGGTSLYTAYRSTKAVSSLNWKATYSLYRPMFCLNDTFFKLGGIDLSSAGSEIINILSQYSYAELSTAGYTDSEIKNYLPTVEMPANKLTVVTTDGNAATVGNTLKAELEDATGNMSYQWYRGGETVSGATSDEYILTFDDQLYGPVKCVVTDGNGTHESEEITVISDFNPESTFVSPTGVSSVGANNAKWTFKMKKNADQSFTLLDTFNNNEGKYLILANQAHGHNGLDYTTPNGAKYDPTVAGSYAEDIVNKAMGTSDNALPTEMKEAINENQVWATEKPSADTAGPTTTAHTTVASVVVPSGWELEKYKDKIDFSLNANVFWLTRYANMAYAAGTEAEPQYAVLMNYVQGTPENGWLNGTNLNIKNRITQLVEGQGWKKTYTYYRPMFCLNDTFFKLGGIDLSSAGSEIINILSQYSYAELSKAGYTDDEISTYLPTVEMVAFDCVTDITVADGVTGNAVESIAGLTDIDVNVKVRSVVDKALTGIVIVALYDLSGQMLGIDGDEMATDAKGTDEVTVKLSNLKGVTDDCILKAYVWDGFATMNPLASVECYTSVKNYASEAIMTSETESQSFFQVTP